MSILNDVLRWSEKDLSLWLRDAARRLLFNEKLTPQDYRELYSLLKREKGIAVAEALEVVPLSADHIPADGGTELSVTLQTMGSLQNVNKITPEQTLSFSEKGVTIIYGGNGAGKSGYARVLKHACRARDRGGEILADVTQAPVAGAVPKATFTASVNGETKTFQWASGTVAPSELSCISVFDTSCASAYLVEGEAAYLPRGLDIVENLANKVVPEVSALLNDEIDKVDTSQGLLAGFDKATEVGKVLVGFGEKTNRDEVSRLGSLSVEEANRISELDIAIAEPDPILKCQSIKISAAHVKSLAKSIKDKEKYTARKALEKLQHMVKEVSDSKLGVELAAKELRSQDELLPGTGESVWKELFMAARKYSTEVAYVGHEFPYEKVDASCVLCQQPIAQAFDRMHRFNKFINENATKLATEKQGVLDKALDTIERSNLDFGFNDVLRVELEGAPAELIVGLELYQEQLNNYRAWMINAARLDDWANKPDLIDSPVAELRRIAASKLWSARVYKKASEPNKLQRLTLELAELKARQGLSAILEAVLALHDRILYRSKLESCKVDLNPRALSAKSKDIAGRIITDSLRKSLDEEFVRLGVGHIKTKLKERVERGKVKFTLLLDLPAAKKIELILSEGEQRAVSLGAFLAELKLSDHGGGIIFDDPVSSLDHVRRRRVAKRLVEEANLRQVIVLTHDIAFLSEIIDSLTDHPGIPHVVHHLEWVGDGAGVVKQGLPWDKTGYKERVRLLQARAKKMAPWPMYPGDDLVNDVRLMYSDIRATIERVVEDVVLNGIVTRFSDMVGVGNLHKITGLRKQDADDIVALWKKCHRVTGAHHQAVNKEIPVAGLDEINADITSIQTLADNVVKYRAKPAEA
ncbi:AAA family ATPase [Pseudomonas chlororaphis]|uniref:AAA family ATPase n=1 Tax=Pseudomonas chlororaphis TaxID=587753 RepID=UPI00215ABDCC|nr:AAA family ATPase [Pseudomonas chlororaphis]UVE46456.1 AAA family ATPase [Pseudomonas chlororaphis]